MKFSSINQPASLAAALLALPLAAQAGLPAPAPERAAPDSGIIPIRVKAGTARPAPDSSADDLPWLYRAGFADRLSPFWFRWMIGSISEEATDGEPEFAAQLAVSTAAPDPAVRARQSVQPSTPGPVQAVRPQGLATEGAAIAPLPQAAGGTLNVDNARVVTADDIYANVFVGVNGNGSITHSAGVFTVTTELDLGYNSARTGTYNLSGTGTLAVKNLYIGGSGVGSFTQTGGTVNATDAINLGATSGGAVTYSISAGVLNTPYLVVGDLGPATFTQSGGSVTTRSNFVQGFQFGGKAATYQFNAGTLTIPNVYSFTVNTGTFNFNGGVLQASATNPTFMQGLLAANVQSGGLKIDTNGFDITIAQPLLHNGAGTDGGLTKQTGAGTLTLTGSNTYNGATTISSGTLTVSNNGGATLGRLQGTPTLTVNSGGTLLLAGSSAVNDRLNDAAAVTLSGGGKISTGALSEGAAPTAPGGAGGAAGVGALTLASTSSGARAIIDFTAATTGSALIFSSLTSASKGAFVNILGFTGTQRGDNGAAGNDRLLFTSDPGFSVADLANWQFTNDAGANFATGGLQIAYNGYYEIVPVPEPATWLAGALLLGGASLTLCRRRRATAV